MTPEDDRRVAEIFEQAVDLPPAEREDFVKRACGSQTVREEVEALLALDAAVEAGAPDFPARVGPYRLVAKLGEGGMSQVFLGLRDDGEFVRRVAVKLIRKEVLTPETMRRFETERQILASLDHPSIARLLDAGRTADGMPYFIMEHIEGEPIDLYCDRHRLTVAERLEIFRQVCLAVHFAHQNLVVHRDIKPSNILVTEAGQPKLLDFGIAKLLNPDLMNRGSEPTVSWGRLLTPEYASPEQILGKPVTAASDVYALGVLLFKLMTGSDPYRLREQPEPELERLILTAEPDTPSACVKRTDATTARDLADLRSTQPRALVRILAGDLDAVTSKALRKEPQNRYLSAEQLAEDVRRHLAGGRPAAAVKPWRWSLAAGALSALLLLSSAAALVWQGSRLAETRAAAEREQARSRQVIAAMERVFEEMPLQGQETAGRDFVAHASRSFQQDLAAQPQTQADLLMTVGRACFRMGLSEEAASSFQAALATRQKLLGAEHEAVAESLTALALVEASQGDLQGAEDLHTRALAIRRKLHPGDSLAVTESLVGLGRVYLAKGHAAIAEPLLQEAFLTRRRLLGESDLRVAETLTNLGHAVGGLGNPDAADLLFLRAAKIHRRAAGDETWGRAINLVHRAAARLEQGEREDAREILREASRIERRLCGEDNPDLPGSLLGFADAALRGTPNRPAGPGCRTPPLAVPHLSYLLRGLSLGLRDLGYTVEAESLLEQAGTLRMPAPPPPERPGAAGACVPDGGIAGTLESR
ncbi:MAG TPA: serine/threonine-protein kinase, partial [Thermoanaerobaculia bacterium]|nr:serine/threonine-protein kinase [Thermoanaerobaculia bacterium]